MLVCPTACVPKELANHRTDIVLLSYVQKKFLTSYGRLTLHSQEKLPFISLWLLIDTLNIEVKHLREKGLNKCMSPPRGTCANF